MADESELEMVLGSEQAQPVHSAGFTRRTLVGIVGSILGVLAVCTVIASTDTPSLRANVLRSAPQQKWVGKSEGAIENKFQACDSAGGTPQIAEAYISGDFIFTSGVVGFEEICKSVVKDQDAQFKKLFEMLGKSLANAGVKPGDIVSATSYHVNMGKTIASFIKQRAAFFTGITKSQYPAWTAVGVSELYYEGQLAEVTVMARKPPCMTFEC
mmetsp:Transcript_23908/g.52733  ORF Transcript_23908/g.52733 Transcript_23908/m.52733 type:complete len:213 (-) Transcript_23908:69-707(-)